MSTIAEYYSLQPGTFGPIILLEFSQTQDGEGQDGLISQRLQLVLARSPDLSEERLVLVFRGVSGLCFEQPSWSLAAFGLIELHEGPAGFSATEEEGLLAFRFKSFDAYLEGRRETARPRQ
jgi:hypothetical protein